MFSELMQPVKAGSVRPLLGPLDGSVTGCEVALRPTTLEEGRRQKLADQPRSRNCVVIVLRIRGDLSGDVIEAGHHLSQLPGRAAD